MGNFGLTDAEATALLTLLRSFNGDEVPEEFFNRLTPRQAALERGRRLAERYNCVGCHVIEGKGGEIRKLYRDASLAPPSLSGEGAKVQPQWLFDFLKSPTPLRPWLKVRMPSFGLTDEEASDLVRYFTAQDEARDTPYVFVDEEAISPGMVAVGKKIFQEFQCLECHVQTPGKEAGDLAPDLSLSRRRLRPDWLLKWLEDPQKIQAGTKMPTFFEGGQSPLTEVWKGDAKKQIQALRDYLMRFDGGKGEVTGIPPGVITKEEDEKKK
jgi:mono/diheme cytochrome c family protein